MEKKDTDDLRQELMEAGDIDSYLRENQENFAIAPIAGLLTEIYEQKNISKAALARVKFISTRCSLEGAILPGTGFCACASAFPPRWRKPRNCCNMWVMRSSIPASNGMLLCSMG